MLMRPISHTGLLAGAVILALAGTASAASVTWQAGPLNLGAGRMAQVAVSNPNPYSCLVSVQLQAGPAGRVVAGASSGSMTLVVNTYTDPDLMPAGGVVVVGFHDPNLMPEQRRLVTARVQTDCPSVTAVDIRTGLGMTLQIGDPNLGTTTAALAGQVR